MRKPLVVVLSNSSQSWYETVFNGLVTLLSDLCELKLCTFTSDEDIIKAIEFADVIMGPKATQLILESANHLRMIQTLGTGVDNIDLEAAAARGITVCNASGYNSIWVAEHAVALLLGLAKNLPKYDREVKAGLWQRMQSTALYHKTLGIVGLGSIGIEVVKRMMPFDMRIMATKRHPSPALRAELGLSFLGEPKDLNRLLTESDFIIITLPLNNETRELIGRDQLRIMKKSAFLINVSRGEIIDENALAEALISGTIAGAGLDVFVNEPLLESSPLLGLQNIILTPDVAGTGGTAEALTSRSEFLAKNIRRFLLGQTPENIVDTKLRYSPRKH